MRATQQSITATKVRRRLARLAAALAALLATGLIVAAPAGALAPADPRAPVTINAFLDEPSWAYLDRPSLVQISLVVPAGQTRVPTGTLKVTAHEPGAVPSVVTVTGDEGNFYIPIQPTQIGTRYYTVSYSGDAFFKPSALRASYVALTGPEIRTALQSATAGSVLVSQPVKLTATVRAASGARMNGIPDGPIMFYADGVAVGEGIAVAGSSGWSATLSLDSLAVGRHRITANLESVIHYFGPASAPVYVDVKAHAAGLPVTGRHTVMQDGPGGSWARSAVTVRAARTGDPAPAGYVQFYVDGSAPGLPVKLVAGKAACDYVPLGAGTHRIRAVYLGDTRHRPAELPVRTVTVTGPAS